LVSRAGLLYRKPATPLTASRTESVSFSQSHVSLLAVTAPDGLDRSLELPPTAAGLHLDSQPALTRSAPGAANDTTPVGAAAVRRTWNAQGAAPALVRCTQELSEAPNMLELLYLRALLLWELGQQAEAVSAMRMVLYLDRDQPVAHFGLAVLHERSEELDAARRSYRNVLSSCEGLPGELALPLGDGLTAAGLCTAAEQALARLTGRKVSA
jgi:hypothetical protein